MKKKQRLRISTSRSIFDDHTNKKPVFVFVRYEDGSSRGYHISADTYARLSRVISTAAFGGVLLVTPRLSALGWHARPRR